MKRRILALFICFAVCFVFCSAGKREGENLGDAVCVASLGCIERGDELEIALDVGRKGGLCGLFGELIYDGEMFLLLSCGADVDGGTFSWYDDGEAVRFLLDGLANCGEDGITVSFYFKRVEGERGGAVFSLGCEIEAFYLSEDGSLEQPCVEITSGEVEVCGVDRELEKGENEPPELIDIEVIRGEDGKADVVLVGEASGDYFALGFKIFALELDGGRREILYVSRIVSGEEKTELRADLSMRGGVSLVVTPLGFWRGGIIEWDREVFVFGGGK